MNGQQRKHGISVTSDPADDLPPVIADAIQLQQMLLNVLRNASQAIAAAGDGPRDIHIAFSRRGPDVLEIAVSDTGRGVNDADLGRIFERFVSSKPDGLGMGLPISRSIVLAHGGRMWATRNPERGITIHVELPCEPAAGPAVSGGA